MSGKKTCQRTWREDYWNIRTQENFWQTSGKNLEKRREIGKSSRVKKIGAGRKNNREVCTRAQKSSKKEQI